MDITEEFNNRLKKVKLEVDHYKHAIEKDKERLNFFISVQQYIESELKSIEISNNKDTKDLSVLTENKGDWTKTSANRQK